MMSGNNVLSPTSWIQRIKLPSFLSLLSLTIQSWQGVVLLLRLLGRRLLLLLLSELGHLGNVVLTIVQREVQFRKEGWGWGGWWGGESCSGCPSVAGEGLHRWGRGGRGRRGVEVKGDQVLEELLVSVQRVSSGSGPRGGSEERESWIIVQRVEGALLFLLVAVLLLQRQPAWDVLATRGQKQPTTTWKTPHLVVGVRVQQGRLHVHGGPGGVEDHVVCVLLHLLGVRWILGATNPPLSRARQPGHPGK